MADTGQNQRGSKSDSTSMVFYLQQDKVRDIVRQRQGMARREREMLMDMVRIMVSSECTISRMDLTQVAEN